MTKEEKELIEAISREKGLGMMPVEELALLGYYENYRNAVVKRENYMLEIEPGGEFTALNEVWEKSPDNAKDWNIFEEYDFDENTDEYKELAEVLRRNNDRRKYFA